MAGAGAQALEGGLLKIVVPYPPGGASDRAARLVAEALQPRLGVAATGSLPHFVALMVTEKVGVAPLVVGYKGSAPLLNDLMGGHIPVAVDMLDTLEPQHESGKLRVLGDHWLGEKELFYDTVQRVPLIVVDPSAAADATHGTVESRFVESVDILPTILDAPGLERPAHRLEGRRLLDLLRGQAPAWRDTVFSELDWSFKIARQRLGYRVDQCYAWSLRNERWR